MPKRFQCSEKIGRSSMRTAYQYFRSIELHCVGSMCDPNDTLANDVRQAHAIAVADGYAWDPKGEYPVAVWMKLKRQS